MAKGGYQIIDFGGRELGETAVNIKDAYKKASTGKVILCENVAIDNGPSGFSIFAPSCEVEGGYAISFIIAGTFSVVITIADDDNVTAAVVTLAEAEG